MEKIFKAKRLDNGEWVEFKLEDLLRGYSECLSFIMDKDTICQYTGINDSEGNRIFEGDIQLHKTGVKYIISMSGDSGAVAKNLDGKPLKGIAPLCYEFKLPYAQLTLTGDNIHNRG